MTAETVSTDYVIDAKRDRLVIAASSLGTVFEWYDFFIYGTLAVIIGKTFFPADSDVASLLLTFATFAVGFGFRPVGAVLFGWFGDKLGRKYTFLATITLMGIATAAIALVPPAASIGIAAPIILIILRILQGLALGGEYGGAAIYVCEHAPPGKRGYYTSFIQAGVVGGFILSLGVVLATQFVLGNEAWTAWGWRLPFALSLLLLAISLWMRLKLHESPVFQAMKEAGETAANPLKESFTYPGNIKRLTVALFGIAAGLTVIWYTSMFQVLFFIQNSLRVDPVTAQIIVASGAVMGLGWFIFFGWLSDKIGRRKPIIIGYIATLVLLFPLFHMIGNAANPALAEANRRAPVVVSGSSADCTYALFAKVQKTECGKLLDYLSKKGVAYAKQDAAATGVSIGGTAQADTSSKAMDAALAAAGYDLAPKVPEARQIAIMLLGIFLLGMLTGATYGPVASLLSELFPARIRYSSMSIPYHFGTGYFGGFLPFVASLIVAKTGDPYSWLWYTFAVTAMALVVCLWGLPETRGVRMGGGKDGLDGART
jgi:MFS family permease